MNHLLLILVVSLSFLTISCEDVDFSKSEVNEKVTELSSNLEIESIDPETKDELIIEEIEMKEEATDEEVEVVVEKMEETLTITEMIEKKKVKKCIKKKKEEKIAKNRKKNNKRTKEKTESEKSKVYDCNKKNSKVKKLMICHVPRGNTNNARTLCLPERALKAHVENLSTNGSIGYMGPCKD